MTPSQPPRAPGSIGPKPQRPFPRELVRKTVILSLAMVMFLAYSARVALQKGESLVPVLVSSVLVLVLVPGCMTFIGWRGQAEVLTRAALLTKWAGTGAVVVGLLRILAMALGY